MIKFEMPEDVRQYVVLCQYKKKIATGRNQISQQECIWDIIRDHKRMKEAHDHEPPAKPSPSTPPNG